MPSVRITITARRSVAFFGLLAVFLSCIGIYGLMSYVVSRRTNEIGIRAALGAQKNDILKLILAEGTGLALIGVAAGLALAFLLATTISKLLYGISAHDTLAFLAVPALLLSVAVIASYIPALRATRTDAHLALRHE